MTGLSSLMTLRHIDSLTSIVTRWRVALLQGRMEFSGDMVSHRLASLTKLKF